MKEIIEKLYAEELNLITSKPVILLNKRQFKSSIKRKFWAEQSRSVKTATVSFALLLLSGCVYYYNLYTTEQHMVRLQASQIEAELQRRKDLIPGLVKAVSDYMAYEGKVFVHATDVRSALGSIKDITNDGTTLPVDMKTVSNFKSSVSRFQAVAEKYPDLKSSATYQNLMAELANTETRLAMARANYNKAANHYNTDLELVPGVLFSCVLRFSPSKTFSSDKPL